MKIKTINSIEKNEKNIHTKISKNSQKWEFKIIYFFNLIKIAIDNKIKSIPITISNILRIVDNSKPELEVEFILLTVVEGEFRESVAELFEIELLVFIEDELALL